MNKAVVGGPVSCDKGSSGGPVLTPNKKKEFLDWLNNCPQCTKRRRLGQDLVYEIKDVNKFKQSAIGRHVTSAIKPRARKTRRRAIKR